MKVPTCSTTCVLLLATLLCAQAAKPFPAGEPPLFPGFPCCNGHCFHLYNRCRCAVSAEHGAVARLYCTRARDRSLRFRRTHVLQVFCQGGTYWRVTRPLQLQRPRAIRLQLQPQLQVGTLASDSLVTCLLANNAVFANLNNCISLTKLQV